MNKVPQKLRRQWREDEWQGKLRVCARSDEGNCQGRLTKEHAIIYAGKKVQEDWACLDMCAYHHGVDEFQDCGDMNKEKHIWLALKRAPEERLLALSKAINLVALRDRLSLKYETT